MNLNGATTPPAFLFGAGGVLPCSAVYGGVSSLTPRPMTPTRVTNGAAYGSVMKEVQCACGNVFMPDSEYCRMCGRHRNSVAFGFGLASREAYSARASFGHSQGLRPLTPSSVVLRPPTPGTYSSCSQERGFTGNGYDQNVLAAGWDAPPSIPIQVMEPSQTREISVEYQLQPQVESRQVYDVIRPVVKEVVKEVPRAYKEHHTVIRELPQVEYIETRVEVPHVQVTERTVEVPTTLVMESIVEVPQVQRHEQIRQVTVAQYQDRIKQVARPVHEGRELLVDVPHPLVKERIIEVPQPHYVDCVREVHRPQIQQVTKHVAKPVMQIRERQVEVPTTTLREQIVEVPVIEQVELIKQVLGRNEVQRVEKTIQKPEVQLVDRYEDVPDVEVQEHIIEVPQIEHREYIRQVSKVQVQYIDKHVPKPVIEYVEKIVEVPTIVYEEHIVEVPEVEIQEVIKQVQVPVIKYVDKPIPKAVMNYIERIVEVPVMLHQERAVEVPQHQVVEVLTQVPKPQYRTVPREVPIVTIQCQERVIETPVTLRQEQVVEVPEVQFAEAVTQILKPQTEYVDKTVPVYETQVVEKVVEVPHQLVEERYQEVPQVQIAEYLREELQPFVNEVIKEVPRVKVDYVEKIVEVQSQLLQEHHENGAVRSRSLGLRRGDEALKDVFVQEERFESAMGTNRLAEASISYVPATSRSLYNGRSNANSGASIGLAGYSTGPITMSSAEYVLIQGQQLPYYSEAFLRMMLPAQLRDYAVLLYTVLGQQSFLPNIPLRDSELLAWILDVQRSYLEPHLGPKAWSSGVASKEVSVESVGYSIGMPIDVNGGGRSDYSIVGTTDFSGKWGGRSVLSQVPVRYPSIVTTAMQGSITPPVPSILPSMRPMSVPQAFALSQPRGCGSQSPWG